MIAKQRSTTDQKPNAWIVNPNDRGRKSIKTGNKVYLQDSQNFEIELFNPLKEPVLADIKVNGKSVSSSGLVLRPGERFYLDCFIDDKKKFVFNTYMVENTEECRDAISGNGLVEVFFYKEETLSINNWRDKFAPVIINEYYPYWYPWCNPVWYGSTYNYYGTINGSGMCATTIADTNFGNISLNNTGTQVYTNTFSSNINYSDPLVTSDIKIDYETGRVEMGSSSSQEFTEVSMQFEKLHISNVVYQLLPESQRPIETKEIKKKFCTECGFKLKGTEKFCSDCGEKL